MNRQVIGIDIGTSYTRVGVWINNNFQIIPIDGFQNYPSVISFDDVGVVTVVGIRKKSFLKFKDGFTDYSTTTIFDIKRLVGRYFPDRTVQEDLKILPYSIVCPSSNKIAIQISTKQYTPLELFAFILYKACSAASSYLGCRIKESVISVPSSFNNTQRRFIIKAASVIGLHVNRLINGILLLSNFC